MKIYDIIKIKDLEIFANHGVFPEETRLGQKFLVSITMYTDTRKAGMTDDLTASIHYGEVSRFVDSYLKEHTFLLIERAAEALARELLVGTPHLDKCVWKSRNHGRRWDFRLIRFLWKSSVHGIRHILRWDPISGIRTIPERCSESAGCMPGFGSCPLFQILCDAAVWYGGAG